jgi:membrane-associated phospholipid phosphatase
MNELLSFGVSINIWLQQFSPGLDTPFKAITFCGEELFFLIFLPLIYWSINRAAGARLLVIFLFSAWINSFAKVIANDQRPYQYDNRVKALQQVESGGFPSGHTQGSVVVWGYLAAAMRKQWLWIFAVIMMILVPLSRLYLGVHDLPDLIGGYIIGFILLMLFIWLEPVAVRWLEGKSLAVLLAISIIIPGIMIAVSPEFDEGCITAASTLMGMLTGFVLERKYIVFSSDGTILRRILRYVLGLVVIIGLWIGLKIAFKGLEPALMFRFTRYLLIGLWGSFAAPWVFVKLKLADEEQNRV